MLKMKALVMILLVGAVWATVVMGQKKIDKVFWVCHEFGEGRHQIPVQTPWKLKVHLDHGDTLTNKKGQNCPPRRR